MKRLFIAINIPQELKEKISQTFLQKIKNKDISPVKKENLHITIKFLGHLNEKNTQLVKEKLNTLEFKEFQATLTGIGEFNARVLWLGAQENAGQMQKIAQQLNELLGTSDERFHPHITLVRNKHMQKEDFKKLVQELSQARLNENFAVKSIDLMESQLLPQGTQYIKIFGKKTQK